MILLSPDRGIHLNFKAIIETRNAIYDRRAEGIEHADDLCALNYFLFQPSPDFGSARYEVPVAAFPRT